MLDEAKDRLLQSYMGRPYQVPVHPENASHWRGKHPYYYRHIAHRGRCLCLKAGIRFLLKDRLCVPHSMIDGVLRIARDDQSRFGAEKMSRELAGLSINNLSQRAKEHIHGYKSCRLGQTN